MPRLIMLPPQTALTEEWAGRLRAELPEYTIEIARDTGEAAAMLSGAEAAYGTLPPDLLDRAGAMRWLQAPQAAPPAGFYYPALAAHPVAVTNMREIYNDHIGAQIMAYVLAFARDLPRYIRQQAEATWRKPPEDEGVLHLPDCTMLIAGVGGIGAEAARLAASFGMTVIGTDARRTESPPGMAELHPPEALDALLPRADFVVVTLPHTPKTEGLFDAGRFARMKPGAIFINIGRGMTTRLDDLVAALRTGPLGGAALDVFEQEPLPGEHPLWQLPNVILTPHMAGYGPYLNERRFAILRDNARAFAAGRPLRNLVDKTAWF